MPQEQPRPLVAILMGSKADYEHMSAARELLDELEIPVEVRVLSAHRTPDQVLEYAEQAQARGLKVIVAGAGGAAHLAGLLAAKTLLPVVGVPMPTTSLGGLDALLATVQMPAGVPVATMAIGRAGAANAAAFAAAVIALGDAKVARRLDQWRAKRRRAVLEQKLP
jgi:5-(carboxyamino)imidazole ribonucleotide mutase